MISVVCAIIEDEAGRLSLSESLCLGQKLKGQEND
jgi:hypothetical protein